MHQITIAFMGLLGTITLIWIFESLKSMIMKIKMEEIEYEKAKQALKDLSAIVGTPFNEIGYYNRIDPISIQILIAKISKINKEK